MRRYPIPRGTPSAGALNTRVWDKLTIFDGNRRLPRKWCEHFADISTDSTYQSPFQKATVNQAKQEFTEFSEYFIFNLLDKLKQQPLG